MLSFTERLSLSTPLKSRAPSPWWVLGSVRKDHNKNMLPSPNNAGLVSLGATARLGSHLEVALMKMKDQGGQSYLSTGSVSPA